MKHILSSTILASILGTVAWAEDTVLPAFEPAQFSNPMVIDNPYLPFAAGMTINLGGSKVEEGATVVERIEMTIDGPGPVVAGIATLQMTDTAFVDDVMVEQTIDFFAQDDSGNVWYMGEDVINYVYDDAGNLTETNNHGGWRAGVDDALPGVVMFGKPEMGANYYQEFAEKNEALDYAIVVGTDETVTVGGKEFTGVVKTLEGNKLDPDALEYKYFVAGIGLIREDEGLSADLATFEMIVERSGL